MDEQMKKNRLLLPKLEFYPAGKESNSQTYLHNDRNHHIQHPDKTLKQNNNLLWNDYMQVTII